MVGIIRVVIRTQQISIENNDANAFKLARIVMSKRRVNLTSLKIIAKINF